MNEKICIENFEIELIRKPRIRRMSLKVRTTGEMSLTTPVGAPDKLIRGFLLQNVGWMKKTQARFDKVRAKHPPKTYKQGDRFCFLGEQFYLHIEDGAKVSLNIDRGQHKMILACPPQLDSAEVAKEYIRDFYSQVGRKYISNRIQEISEQMNLQPTVVSFRSQKTRWGSASTAGRVTFNWRLAIAPTAVIDYVIVHELAHLKHMNHSDRFWNLVEKYCPEHKKLKSWLNKNRYESDFLADSSELHIGKETEDDLD